MHVTSRRVGVVFAPGAVAHQGTAAELIDRALVARGLTGNIVFARDAPEFDAAVAAEGGECIVVPGAGISFVAPPAGAIRVDLGPSPADRSAGIRVHIRGRGLEGLRYAVDSWYHHRCHPGTIRAYGAHPDQCGELRIPQGPGPFPAVMLIHGGYWRTRWEFDLMDAPAVDLTGRGYLTWNIEYRRPDEYGWAATTDDVAAALQALATLAQVDPERVVMVGHSAGAQLALRAAADAVADPTGVRPALAVSLAGVLNLCLADERRLSEGAVANALGGHWPDHRGTYERSSPYHRVPLGLPQLIASTVHDDPNLLEISRQYCLAAPDEITQIEGPGGHFDIIDPTQEIWKHVAAAIHARTACA